MTIHAENGGHATYYHSFSIVIEWENILLSEAWRTHKMLQELRQQIIQIYPKLLSKPEIIVVHNSEQMERSQVEQFVNEQFEACSSLIQLRIIPASGLHYYDLKNFGAKHSKGELIIFLDSDVIPEDGWLVSLLESFQHSDVLVVGGNTYMTAGSVYEKSLALLYFLPRGSDTTGCICEVCKSEDFFANNVAFRRELFESYPFPTLPQVRGQCQALAEMLQSLGVKIFYQPRSSVSHPAPNGLRHFVITAMCHGHDVVMTYRRRAVSVNVTVESKHDWRKHKSIRQKFFKVYQRYRNAGLSRKDTIIAFGVISSYLTFVFLGILIGLIRPELIRRHLAI